MLWTRNLAGSRTIWPLLVVATLELSLVKLNAAFSSLIIVLGILAYQKLETKLYLTKLIVHLSSPLWLSSVNSWWFEHFFLQDHLIGQSWDYRWQQRSPIHSLANCLKVLLLNGMLSVTRVLGMPCREKICFIFLTVVSAVLLLMRATSGYLEK